uniref:Uncharacterized protein n=1 Tax=viral metagenome TaxID=1070528 RepID=A0A2V0RA42_9ZZZZ
MNDTVDAEQFTTAVTSNTIAGVLSSVIFLLVTAVGKLCWDLYNREFPALQSTVNDVAKLAEASVRIATCVDRFQSKRRGGRRESSPTRGDLVGALEILNGLSHKEGV